MSHILNSAFQIYKYWHNKEIEFENEYYSKFMHSFRSVENGEIITISQNKTVITQKGEVLYIPPGINVTIKFTRPSTHGMVIRLNYFPDVDEITFPMQTFKISNELMDYLQSQPNRSFSENVTCRQMVNTYKIIDAFQDSMKKREDKHTDSLEKALEFMRECNNYTIPELAQYCGMSERRFYAVFKEALGFTPIQMKHKIQTEKARLLLKTTNLSIKEISAQLGFDSDSQFRKIFIKRFGSPPKYMRK